MRLKDTFKHKKIREVFFNILYLALSQLVNYIVPILMIPVLLQRIGYEKLGTIATYQALFIYVSIITDFGFNLISTAEVAKSNEDVRVIQRIFNYTTTSKFFLLIASVALCYPFISFFFEEEKLRWSIILSLFFAGLGNVLFSEWLLQGLKKVKNQFIAVFFSKTLSFFITFFFVLNPKDYILVIYFDAFSYLLAGLISVTIIRLNLGYKLSFVSFRNVINQLRIGFYTFISNALTTLYTTGNVLVLGYLVGQIEVSMFTVAQRSFFVVYGIFSLFNRILYPYLSQAFSLSKMRYISMINKFAKVVLICTILISIVVYSLAPYIVHFMTKEINGKITLLIELLCLNFVFSPFNSLMTNMLVIEGKGHEIAKINLVGLILSLTVTASLIYYYKSLGLVIGSLIINIVILFLSFKKTNFKNIIFKKGYE